MPDIIVIEKPINMSFKVIRSVLQKAHQSNHENGIVMKTPNLSAKEQEEIIGQDGKCFVAMDGNEVVGTASFRIKNINRWFYKGKTAEFIMAGIIPEYRGKHIFPMLEDIRTKAIKEMGINSIQFMTAEKNIRRQKIAIKDGYRYVDFFSGDPNQYYTVMFRWLDKCPFSRTYCFFRYNLKKIYTKIRYKPGKIKRFGL